MAEQPMEPKPNNPFDQFVTQQQQQPVGLGDNNNDINYNTTSTSTQQQQQQQQQQPLRRGGGGGGGEAGTTSSPTRAPTIIPTPIHSNRSTDYLATGGGNNNNSAAMTSTFVDVDDGSTTDSMNKQLIIRITTRPIMSWSPQLIHSDGSSHTMTIDLPIEFTVSNSKHVITQQGWSDLYHYIVTAVTKNTTESILLFWFWFAIFLLIAVLFLFRIIYDLRIRLITLFTVVCVCIGMGITHTIIRRIRVQNAVCKCVEECFYDDHDHEMNNAAAISAGAGASSAAEAIGAEAYTAVAEEGTTTIQQQQQENNEDNDIEQSKFQQQQQQQQDTTDVMGGLDGLQELEEDGTNVDGAAPAATTSSSSSMGFGRIIQTIPLRQRLNSHSSSVHSNSQSHSQSHSQSQHSNNNRQRLNTGDSSKADSNMIFDEQTRNRAISRDGMYCVDWKWEYFGMDAVVKISWE